MSGSDALPTPREAQGKGSLASFPRISLTPYCIHPPRFCLWHTQGWTAGAGRAHSSEVPCTWDHRVHLHHGNRPLQQSRAGRKPGAFSTGAQDGSWPPFLPPGPLPSHLHPPWALTMEGMAPSTGGGRVWAVGAGMRAVSLERTSAQPRPSAREAPFQPALPTAQVITQLCLCPLQHCHQLP